jgi:chromosome segregation ATPase
MQRAVWAWLDWVSADSGSSDEPAALCAGRKLVEEIEAGDKNVSGRVFTGGREVRLNATIKRLKEERDKLKEELEKCYSSRRHFQQTAFDLDTELSNTRRSSQAYHQTVRQDLQPLCEYLNLEPTDAGRSGYIVERVLQKIRALEKERAALKTQVDGLIDGRRKALFSLGAADAK